MEDYAHCYFCKASFTMCFFLKDLKKRFACEILDSKRRQTNISCSAVVMISHLLSDCQMTATFFNTSLITATRQCIGCIAWQVNKAQHSSPVELGLWNLTLAAACGRLGFTRTMATTVSHTQVTLSVTHFRLIISQWNCRKDSLWYRSHIREYHRHIWW